MALKPARLQWSGDGSLRSLDFDDIYFLPGQGVGESAYVFLEKNRLPERFSKAAESFRIAELGFGTGLNFLLTARLFAETAPAQARLFYASIEKHPVAKDDLAKVLAYFGELTDAPSLLDQYPPPLAGAHHLWFCGGRIRLLLAFGDVTEVLPQLTGKFDAWYLDGFAPAKNPDMWQDSLFPLIAARTAPGGTLATFSAAAQVRNGLAAAGFTVQKTPGFGVKRVMTVAELPGRETPAARKQTLVLGAGVGGCAAAHALARRGHTVTVLERNTQPAGEASGNPFGILYPRPSIDPSPFSAFHEHAFLFARGLLRSLGLPSWRECGVLHNDAALGGKERREALLARSGWPEELAADTGSGIFQRLAGMLAPGEFCRRLLDFSGIAPRYGQDVAKLVKTAQGWAALDESGKALAEAEIAVIALNYASKGFAETEWLPLQGLRGQTTWLRATPQSGGLDKVLCYGGYITPAVEGLHHIGATFQRLEPGKEMPAPRPEDDAENLSTLQDQLPELGFTAADIAGSRAGYRVTTPDKLPVIGPCPDYEEARKAFAGLREGKIAVTGTPPRHEGLYVSTGFGAHGLSGAPLAGEIIAAMVSGETLPVPESLLEYLLPERHIFRGLKRQKI